MALFPLSQPLNGLDVLVYACRLYWKSLWSILPASITFALLVYLINDGDRFWPTDLQLDFSSVAMFLVVFALPVVASFFVILHHCAQDKPCSMIDVVSRIADRLISFIATLVSMLLLPAIVFAIITALHLIALKQNIFPLNVYLYRSLLAIVVFAIMIPKIFAIVIVLIESSDANSALDKSSLLVQGDFWSTFIQMLLVIGLFIALLTSALWLPFVLPTLKENNTAIQLISAGLIALISPWVFAYWYVLEASLETKKKERLAKH